MDKLKKDLEALHASEKERQEMEVKVAKDRQRAIDDLDKGVSLTLYTQI